MKRVSPTQLTLKELRKRGIPSAIVEKWVKTPQGGFRRDTFGFDILSLVGVDTLGVQAGIRAHDATKITHAIEHPDVKLWLSSPHRIFQIWTWQKMPHYNASGIRAKRDRWTPKVSQLVLVDGKITVCDFTLKTS